MVTLYCDKVQNWRKKAMLYFVQDFEVKFLTAKCIDLSLLIDYSMYFKDKIQYYLCQFSLVSA